MKQQNNLKTKAESDSQQDLQNVSLGQFKTNNRIVCENMRFQSPLLWRGKGEAFAFTIGKAPPGRSRSPGAARGHPPENKAGPPWGSPPINQTELRIEKEELINKYQISNFYKHLIFIIMKKQILFLSMFILAIFASIQSYGQTFTPIIADGVPATYQNVLPNATPDCAAVKPLAAGCAGAATYTELSPQVGVSYTYNVTTSTVGSDQIHWFVIANQTNLITAVNNITALAAAGIVDPGDGLGTYIQATQAAIYNKPTQTANALDVTWKYFDGQANVVLLVAYVVNSGGCTDNIQVYRIMPTFKFTLDIAALDAAGKLFASPTQCVSPVESATYAAGTAPGNGHLTVDYGENWLFFTVAAANFKNSWLPSFQVTNTGGDAAVTTIEWALASNANSVVAADWHLSTDNTPVPVVDQAAVDAGTPECIVVRVRLNYGTAAENQAPKTQDVKLAVNGVQWNPTSNDYTNLALKDISDVDCKPYDFDDFVDYTITARPNITSNTGTGPQPFEIKP